MNFSRSELLFKAKESVIGELYLRVYCPLKYILNISLDVCIGFKSYIRRVDDGKDKNEENTFQNRSFQVIFINVAENVLKEKEYHPLGHEYFHVGVFLLFHNQSGCLPNQNKVTKDSVHKIGGT